MCNRGLKLAKGCRRVKNRVKQLRYDAIGLRTVVEECELM